MVQTQLVYWKHLGLSPFYEVWQWQEALLVEGCDIKKRENNTAADARTTVHKLLLTEHPPVYTLGKSGSMDNLLISQQDMREEGIAFYKINRGGDITHHGPGQLVAYPILDLEKFYTDIGKYLRNLEEVVIRTLAYYGIRGERSAGETGVWLDAGQPGRERKICAMGVRCSRWITMHGLALNVNNDLRYFDHIIPCGIRDKQVTSIARELGIEVDMEELTMIFLQEFGVVFNVRFAVMD
jgi:lipoyl(octanoyl) transferase